MVGPLSVVRRLVAVASLVPELLDRADDLLAQASLAVEEVRSTRARAEQAIDAIDGVAAHAAAAVATIEGLTARAEALLAVADIPDADLARAVSGAVQILGAVPQALLDQLPGLLRAATSALDSDSTSAVARLVREAPELLDQLDDVVLPAYRLLSEVVPEVVALRELGERFEPVVLDLSTRIAGLPGMKRAKKRGLEDEDVQRAVQALAANDEQDARAAGQPARADGSP